MEPHRILEHAEKLCRQGREKAAAELYATLIGHPTFAARANVALGRINLAQGFLDRAERHFRAAQSDPEVGAAAMHNLAEVAEQRGNGARARGSGDSGRATVPPLSRTAGRASVGSGPRPAPTGSAAVPPSVSDRPRATRREYRRSLLGTVTRQDQRRENYLGQMNALTVVDLSVDLHEGGKAHVTLTGTRILGPVPRPDQLIEVDLDRARREGHSGNAYTASALFNHDAQAETTAVMHVVGATGRARSALRAAYALPVLLVLAGAALCAGIAPNAPWRATTTTLTVPALHGRTMDEARSLVERAGFEAGEYDIVSKPGRTPPGTVFATEPGFGDTVDVERRWGSTPATHLTVYVSTGRQ